MGEESLVSVLIDFSLVHDVPTAKSVLEKATMYGKVLRARIYLEQSEMDAYRDTVSEISKLGIEPIVTPIARDVRFALDLMEDAYDKRLSYIIVTHNRESIIPALLYAKTLKRIIVISPMKVPKSFESVAEEIIIL